MRECGGCQGLGSHWRWCPTSVGHAASMLGRYAMQAESLGDSVGANNTAAANLLYAAAGHLYDDARAHKEAYQRKVKKTDAAE